MTPASPVLFVSAQPVVFRSVGRALTRQQAHDRLLRLCEAVLWSMARRRMH